MKPGTIPVVLAIKASLAELTGKSAPAIAAE
jgi:hypothetical protein